MITLGFILQIYEISKTQDLSPTIYKFFFQLYRVLGVVRIIDTYVADILDAKDKFGADIVVDIRDITYICYMSDKERKKFSEAIKKYTTKLSKNKEASKQFLVDTGIITEKGNLREPYKPLCIPQEVD